MHVVPNVYPNLETSVLFVHALFIVWVVFGALFTRSRPILRWLHIASLIWGLLTELVPWPCPLTLLENWLEQKAGVAPYQGGFLLHYMDKLDCGWSDRLCLQPRTLWKASVENTE